VEGRGGHESAGHDPGAESSAPPEAAAASRSPAAAPGSDQDVVFDRVLFLRHLAIFGGAVVAYLQSSRLGIGWAVFAIVVASGALNLTASFLHRRPGRRLPTEIGSSVVGVACWTALVAITGGVASPFVAGLWLEIILAAMLFALTGIVAVTVWSIVCLFVLQLAYGVEGLWVTLGLNCAFLAGMGGLTYWVASRALLTEERLVRERDALDERLQHLEVELGHEREVGRLGENVARLAHGLKNAIHSLRGFVGLIEPTIGERADAAAALAGLRTAIDDLEALARMTLAPGVDAEPPQTALEEPRCRAAVVVERAVREVGFSHPDVTWSVEGDPVQVEPAIAAEDLFEVLVILLRNAVEAMGGEGGVRIGLTRDAGELRVAVSDEGPGIAREDLGRIFEPGFTTKAGGSGYGLFLARRIVGDVGGRLDARPAPGRGTVMDLRLPVEKA